MRQEHPRDMAASVKGRLLHIARAQQEERALVRSTLKDERGKVRYFTDVTQHL